MTETEVSNRKLDHALAPLLQNPDTQDPSFQSSARRLRPSILSHERVPVKHAAQPTRPTLAAPHPRSLDPQQMTRRAHTTPCIMPTKRLTRLLRALSPAPCVHQQPVSRLLPANWALKNRQATNMTMTRLFPHDPTRTLSLAMSTSTSTYSTLNSCSIQLNTSLKLQIEDTPFSASNPPFLHPEP